METVRLRKIQKPSRVERLLEAFAESANMLPPDCYRIRDVLTLDERHFRPLRTLDGQPFRLIPTDA